MGWHVVGPLPGMSVVFLREKGISESTTVTGLWGLAVTHVSLPQFHPRTAPLLGRTRVTLCGMTFRSHPDPDPSRSPRSAYRVTVGRRRCTVLPEESQTYRCAQYWERTAAERGLGLPPAWG